MATGKVEKGGGKAWKNGRGKDGRWEEVGRCQSSKEEARIHSLCDWVVSMEEDRNSFNFFIVEQQKREDFLCSENGLGACCLTILILLRVLNVLRGRCDHATPTFADLKA